MQRISSINIELVKWEQGTHEGHQSRSPEDGTGVILIPICCEGLTSGKAENKTESPSVPSGLPSWLPPHPPSLEKTSETCSFTGFSPNYNPRQLTTSLLLYLRICFSPRLAFPPSPKTPRRNFLSIFNIHLKHQVFCENFLQRHHSSGKKVGFEFSQNFASLPSNLCGLGKIV